MSETVMRVNGSPVSRYELNTVLQEFALEQSGEERRDRPARDELVKLARERLIARELIYQSALAEGVVADEGAVEDECRRAMDGFRSEDEFLKALAKAGGDLRLFQRSIRKDASVAKMSRKYLADLEPPSEDEIEAFYKTHPERLEIPATYDLRQLLVTFDAASREEASRSIRQLKQRAEDEDFVALVRAHSDCPSALKDGVLSGVQPDQMAPGIRETLDTLEAGVVGGPIETATGFHLVERLDYSPASLPSLAECRGRIVAYLTRDRQSRALSSWVDTLQKGAVIEHLAD